MNYSYPVQRLNAAQLWLLMIISFAVSVVATRVYLEATGYPQIGGGVLHIAHILWGGLLLFIALCVFITYANPWGLPISALLGGAGVGLFIDEVGKFITRDNDYFFPLAAPIIYAVFLFTVFIYLLIRQRNPSSNTRAALYWVLDEIKDGVDNDFILSQRDQALEQLHMALKDPMINAHEKHLAEVLIETVQSLQAAPLAPPSWIHRLVSKAQVWEARWVPRRLLKWVLMIAFFISSFGGLLGVLVLFLVLSDNTFMKDFVEVVISEQITPSSANTIWLLIDLVTAGLTGLLFFIAGGLLLLGRDVHGLFMGRLALMMQLTIVNLLAFYFSQFATLTSTFIFLLIFFALQRYQTRFYPNDDPILPEEIQIQTVFRGKNLPEQQ